MLQTAQESVSEPCLRRRLVLDKPDEPQGPGTLGEQQVGSIPLGEQQVGSIPLGEQQVGSIPPPPSMPIPPHATEPPPPPTPEPAEALSEPPLPAPSQPPSHNTIETPVETTTGEASIAELPQQSAEQVTTRRMQFKGKATAKETKAAKKASNKSKKDAKKQKQLDKQKKKDEAAETKKAKKAGKQEKQHKLKIEKQQRKRQAENMQDENIKSKPMGAKTSLKYAPHKKKNSNVRKAKTAPCETSGNATETLEESPHACTASFKMAKKRSKRNKLVALQKTLKLKQRRMKAKHSKTIAHETPDKTSQEAGKTKQKQNKTKDSQQHPAKRTAEGKAKLPKTATEAPVPKYVKSLQGILEECKQSNCTHPTWQHPTMDPKSMAFNVYWTRNAVGVMVSKGLLPKKGKKDTSDKSNKKAQVAYFGCPTSCIYTNMFLAKIYVTGLCSASFVFEVRSYIQFCSIRWNSLLGQSST